jgi:hypothetical protein
MRQHRENQRASGLTIEAYCKREKISPSSWWYWRKRLIAQRSSSTPTAVAPVSFLRLSPQIAETAKLEIALPNGARITTVPSCDPDALRRTIRMLSGLRAAR